MLRLLQPRALRRGAVLGIAAPGGPVDAKQLRAGEALLREAGFALRRREDVLARDGYLAGDDARRAAELMQLVRDPEVEGIVCARGGYGCDRILPLLDAGAFRRAAKPLVGYSDITALLLWQRRCAGLIGFHGPMLDRGADLDRGAFEHLLRHLLGEGSLPSVLRGDALVRGRATARLVGGSLTLLAASIGSSWEVDTRGAILLIEDVGERPYRVDRMLQQLRAAGKLERLAAIGVGSFEGCVDERYPQPDVDMVIERALAPLGVPLLRGLPFGHVKRNLAWPMGGRATLDASRGELQLLEWGVRARARSGTRRRARASEVRARRSRGKRK
ncbi:MAG TPA: LD-carboxypeptidase [Myxococcota bacterium]|nr:LD-carboxypeptidase [Myxococcota bacterium]